MKQVYVLGDGQLGRMLRQAGEPLNITVQLIGDGIAEMPAADIARLAEAKTITENNDTVITAEIERWPHTPLTERLAQHPAFINREVFPVIADRLTQKQLFTDLNLPTANWQLLSDDNWSPLFNHIGQSLVVKSRTGGYDGRGQWRIQSGAGINLPTACYGNCIVEQAIDFSAEVSLVAARNHRGECLFYPLTQNFHQQGILRASVVLPPLLSSASSSPASSQPFLQKQAQALLSTIMQRLNYIGVMAMECFVTPTGLLINELAPRVHNSGHWTQNAASVSQFALHLCHILNLPVAAPQTDQPAVMINLIGCELNYQWLNLPYVYLHWYHKTVRPGRKVGHLNLSAPTAGPLQQTLERLLPLLPEDYLPALRWAQNTLQSA